MPRLRESPRVEQNRSDRPPRATSAQPGRSLRPEKSPVLPRVQSRWQSTGRSGRLCRRPSPGPLCSSTIYLWCIGYGPISISGGVRKPVAVGGLVPHPPNGESVPATSVWPDPVGFCGYRAPSFFRLDRGN